MLGSFEFFEEPQDLLRLEVDPLERPPAAHVLDEESVGNVDVFDDGVI